MGKNDINVKFEETYIKNLIDSLGPKKAEGVAFNVYVSKMAVDNFKKSCQKLGLPMSRVVTKFFEDFSKTVLNIKD